MQTIALAPGVDLLVLQDERFKTAQLSVALFMPMKTETASVYALLPDLLCHATAAYPDTVTLERRLSRLYGASVGGNVLRIGDYQVMSIGVSCIENRFAPDGEDVVGSCAALLTDMLFAPHLDVDGLFFQTDFQQEKRCLLDRIAARVNDKRGYAREKCQELLVPGDIYGYPLLGTVETAQALTRQTATAALQTVLKTAKIQWIYTASDDGLAIAALLRQRFTDTQRKVCARMTDTAFVPAITPRRGKEMMPVAQAKLVLGFRIAAAEPQKQDVMAARVMTALFGGTPYSLLFRNVREKMSLCYYCHAGYDRLKGVITVDSGVDVANISRAEQAILQQLEAIRNGEFSDEDFMSAKRSLENAFKETENLQSGMFGWYVSQSLYPPFLTPAQTAAGIQAVTREEVCRIARTVSLQSIFTVLPEGEPNV